MDESILVLGSNSFFGSHFVADALEAGYRVIGISRSPEPATYFLPYKWGRDGDFTFHRIDINNELAKLFALISQKKPAYIVNFAALGMVAESWKSPGDWFRTNTLSQVLLHDELRRYDFLRKYVHISTPEVYGATSGRIAETFLYNPSTPYAVSRAAADMSLSSFFRAYNFPVVFTRTANIYGPGQQLYRLVPRTIAAAFGGEKMRLNNAGASQRSFIHVRDAVKATRLVMERGKTGEVYHIATLRLSSIREIAEITAATANAALEDIADIGPARLGRDAIYNLDTSKIRTELSWSDATSLEEGIAETVNWMRQNWNEIRNLPLQYSHKS